MEIYFQRLLIFKIQVLRLANKEAPEKETRNK